MRKATLIPCLIAALVASACGDKRPKTGDANAAEVTTSTPTSPSNPGPVSFESANTAFTDKRYAEAVRLFTTYTTDKPGDVWGQYMLGLSAWRTGDRDGAVDAFKRALAIDSASGEGYRILGRTKDELGDTTGAVEAFKRAIVLDERDVWSMNNLASVSISQHNYADALGPLARAIEIDSTVATFHNNLGFALEKTGYITQALDEYRAALVIDPTYQKASRNLARVEGVPKDSTVAPAELGKLSRSFLEQVQSWH